MVILISFSVVGLLAFIVFLIIYIKILKMNHEKNINKIQFFKIKPRDRVIKMIPSPGASYNKKFFKLHKVNNYESWDEFVELFKNNKEVVKELENSMVHMQDRTKNIIQIEKKVVGLGYVKNSKVSLKFSFNRIDDSSEYFLLLRAKVYKKKSIKTKTNKLLIQDPGILLTKLKKDRHSFISFSLNDNSFEYTSNFIYILSDLLKLQKMNISFYKFKNIVSIVLQDNNYKKLSQSVIYVLNKIKTIGYIIGVRQYFFASSEVTTRHIESISDLHRIENVIEHHQYVSKLKKRTFFCNTHKKITDEEIQKTTMRIELFEEALMNDGVVIEYRKIRALKSSRSVIDMAVPTIKNIDEEAMKFIFSNNYYKEQFNNYLSKKIAIDTTVNKPVMIKTRTSWVLRNINKINNKNAIYILEAKISRSVSKLVEQKQKENLIFGIEIKHWTNQISSFVYNTPFKFILLDFNKEISDDEILETLISLKKIAKDKEIKVVFTKPVRDSIKSRLKGELKIFYCEGSKNEKAR